MDSDDANLEDWSAVAGAFDQHSSLVIGNGLSRSISARFAYQSLRREAQLTSESDTLFRELADTDNFEEVLDSLARAKIVARVLRLPAEPIGPHYSEVRRALLEAVQRVHLRAADFGPARRQTLGDILSSYTKVFTVNYDLLPYWSLMKAPGPSGFVDYFWSTNADGIAATFDPSNVELFGNGRTLLHYLHGASQLWTTGSVEGKWISDGDLLNLDSQWEAHTDRVPLFVSEGSSSAKRQSIARSPYLTFAVGQLQHDAQPTVLFGVGLADQDRHIAEAIAAGPSRDIAVAVWPDPNPDVIGQVKANYRVLLRGNGNRLHFFNSTTHPLGSEALQVPDGETSP